MNEHQLRDLQLQLQLLHQSRRAAVTFARNLRLEQEKATFSDPADKRAVEFILDSQHDLEDFFDQIRHFVDEEGKVVRLRDSERDRLEGFISWCARYCTVLYCTALYGIVSAVLYCTLLICTVLHQVRQHAQQEADPRVRGVQGGQQGGARLGGGDTLQVGTQATACSCFTRDRDQE